MVINNILNADVYREVLSYNENSIRKQVKAHLKEILTESVGKGDKKIQIGLSKFNSMTKLKIAQEILRENGWRVEIRNPQLSDSYLLATLE